MKSFLLQVGNMTTLRGDTTNRARFSTKSQDFKERMLKTSPAPKRSLAAQADWICRAQADRVAKHVARVRAPCAPLLASAFAKAACSNAGVRRYFATRARRRSPPATWTPDGR